ncbi:MAG: hypothetical protein WCW35_13925 [Bacteroidota bacterium]|jgi:hypothetical protein
MKIFAAVILMLFISSCNQEQATGTISQSLTGIPFLASSQNLYEWSFTTDSSGKQLYSFHDSLTISIVSNGEQLFGYSNLTLMEIQSRKNPAGVSRVWHQNANDTLTEVAYSGAGKMPVIMPKSGSAPTVKSQFNVPYLVQTAAARHRSFVDSATKRKDNRIVYCFPLSAGKAWISFRDPFLQKRQVLGVEEVFVKAGRFICTKIRTDIYFSAERDTAIQWIDYVAKEGLILRSLTFRGLITTEQSPDSGFIGTSFERTELVSFH